MRQECLETISNRHYEKLRSVGHWIFVAYLYDIIKVIFMIVIVLLMLYFFYVSDWN